MGYRKKENDTFFIEIYFKINRFSWTFFSSTSFSGNILHHKKSSHYPTLTISAGSNGPSISLDKKLTQKKKKKKSRMKLFSKTTVPSFVLNQTVKLFLQELTFKWILITLYKFSVLMFLRFSWPLRSHKDIALFSTYL